MRSMIVKPEIDIIHGTHYNLKIENRNGTDSSIEITDEEEKLNVDNFLFCVLKNDECISDCLRTGKLFEQFLLSFVRQFVPANKNIIDLGANIGVHTVVYSNYTSETVYAFEPQPRVFQLLKKIIASNKCPNVVSKMFGASSKTSDFFMAVNYEGIQNYGCFQITDNTGQPGIMIQCQKLDDMNLKNIGYIKIDIEGHEYEALKGLEKTIKRDMPNIMIEIHDSCPTKITTFKLLEDMGYTKFWHLTHCDYIFSS